jgi:predicted nucleotidyltransferase
MLNGQIQKRALCALGEFKLKYPNYEIILASVSGSHAFGFAGDNSDVDIVGCYLIPTEEYFVYDENNPIQDTVIMKVEEYNAEIHLHEISKFVNLLIQPNLNMMDAIFVPSGHVVECNQKAYERFKLFGELAVSKAAYPHIQGMIIHMRKHRLTKYNEYDPKKQLYIFREIMRGIIIMKEGKIINNILDLKDKFPEDIESLIRFLIMKKKNKEMLCDDEIELINEKEMKLEAELINSKEFGIVRVRPHDSLKKDSERFIRDLRRQNYENSLRLKNCTST